MKHICSGSNLNLFLRPFGVSTMTPTVFWKPLVPDTVFPRSYRCCGAPHSHSGQDCDILLFLACMNIVLMVSGGSPAASTKRAFRSVRERQDELQWVLIGGYPLTPRARPPTNAIRVPVPCVYQADK